VSALDGWNGWVSLTRGLKNTILPPPIVHGVLDTKGGSVGGGVYCAMVVQSYCNRLGFAGGGGGNNRMSDSDIKALK